MCHTQEHVSVAVVRINTQTLLGCSDSIVVHANTYFERSLLGIVVRLFRIHHNGTCDVIESLLVQATFDLGLMTDVVEVVVDIGLHQFLVVVHVGYCFTELLSTHTSLGACPQVWCSLLKIGLGEGTHSAIHQSQHSCSVFQHLLTTCSTEV